MHDKEILRQQMITFHTAQEVCDMLGIGVEVLLEAFDTRFQEVIDREDREEEEEDA